MNSRNDTRVTRTALEAVAAVLDELGERDLRHMDIAPGNVRVFAAGGHVLLADVLSKPSRPLLLEKWNEIRRRAEDQNAIPLLVLPSLTGSLREIARREAINWVDFAGNAHIAAPPLFLHIEGRPEQRTARGVDPFAARSANVVRQLMADPRRPWRQKDLVDRTELSQPRASRVLTALEAMRLVERDSDGNFRVIDPEGLLDAWADSYSYRRQEIVPVHMTGDGIQLARELAKSMDKADVTFWFTGLPAAWAYDHFARFRLVSVFVDADPELVRRDLGLEAIERGANVHLIAAGDQRLEIGHAVTDGLRCAHPAQVYLDLLGLPERGREAAERLKPLALSGAVHD